jgi:hypothetical protein
MHYATRRYQGNVAPYSALREVHTRSWCHPRRIEAAQHGAGATHPNFSNHNFSCSSCNDTDTSEVPVAALQQHPRHHSSATAALQLVHYHYLRQLELSPPVTCKEQNSSNIFVFVNSNDSIVSAATASASTFSHSGCNPPTTTAAHQLQLQL